MRKLHSRLYLYFLLLIVVVAVTTRFVLAGAHHPVLAVVAMLLLLSVAMRPVARMLSRPIERLTEATRRFGAGELSYRIPLPPWFEHYRQRHLRSHAHRHHRRRRRPVDEVLALTQAWNDMAARIEQQVKGQRALLANVSHELRSPLARIRVALELLPRTPETTTRLADLEADLGELDRLIDDILTASRLEAGAAGARRGPVDVDALLDSLVARAAVDPATSGKVVQRVAAAPLVVNADEALLRRALWNLVENAAKYGAAPITLSATRSAEGGVDALTLAVADEGPGVPPAERERVLEPFYRTDQARTPGRAGFGLGLTLAHRVATAHGGTLVVGAARIADGGAEIGCKVSISLPPAASQNFTPAPGSP